MDDIYLTPKLKHEFDREGSWKSRISALVLGEMIKPEMTERFKDITIIVEKQKFPCHKAVLAAVSPFFLAMFSNDFSEQNKEEIEIKLVSPDVFKGILSFIYGQENPMTPGNVGEYLRAASYLQISILLERCESVITDNLDKSSAIGVWKLAEELNNEYLRKKSWKVILECFVDMKDEEEFLDLDKEDIINIIRDPYLNVRGNVLHACRKDKRQGEELVLDVLIAWVEKEPFNRVISDFIPFIKFPLMSPERFITFLDAYPHLYQDPQCRLVLNEAQRYHMLKECRSEMDSRRIELRDTSGDIDALIFLKSDPMISINGYHFLRKSWFQLEKLSQKFGRGFAACKLNNNLYVSGGRLSNASFCQYKTALDRWVSLPPMRRNVKKHSMVAYKNNIYILGGKADGSIKRKISDEVQRFSKAETLWDSIGKLTVPVCNASALVVDDSILVFGGQTNNEKASVIIQSFDVHTSQCTVIAQLLEPIRTSGAFRANGQIYMKCVNASVVISQTSDTVDIVSVKEYENLNIARPTSSFYGGYWYLTDGKQNDANYQQNIYVIDMKDLHIHHTFENKITGDLQMFRLVVPSKYMKGFL